MQSNPTASTPPAPLPSAYYPTPPGPTPLAPLPSAYCLTPPRLTPQHPPLRVLLDTRPLQAMGLANISSVSGLSFSFLTVFLEEQKILSCEFNCLLLALL